MGHRPGPLTDALDLVAAWLETWWAGERAGSDRPGRLAYGQRLASGEPLSHRRRLALSDLDGWCLEAWEPWSESGTGWRAGPPQGVLSSWGQDDELRVLDFAVFLGAHASRDAGFNFQRRLLRTLRPLDLGWGGVVVPLDGRSARSEIRFLLFFGAWLRGFLDQAGEAVLRSFEEAFPRSARVARRYLGDGGSAVLLERLRTNGLLTLGARSVRAYVASLANVLPEIEGVPRQIRRPANLFLPPVPADASGSMASWPSTTKRPGNLGERLGEDERQAGAVGLGMLYEHGLVRERMGRLDISESSYYRLLRKLGVPKSGRFYAVPSGADGDGVDESVLAREVEARRTRRQALELLMARGFSEEAARKRLQRHPIEAIRTAQPRRPRSRRNSV